MAVSNEVVSQKYACNGVTTSFAIPFDYRLVSTIKVYLITVATGDKTPLVLTTDYTYSPNPTSPTAIVTNTAYSNAYQILVKRESAVTQTTSYIDNGAFLADDHEAGLDKIVLQMQEANDMASRALKVADTSTADTTIPDYVADAVLKVNSAGDGIEMGPTTTEIENAEANALAAAASAADALTSENNAAVSAANAVLAAADYVYGDRFNVLNLSIVTSVAANALTIAVKGKDGNDPSPTNPITVEFINGGVYSRATLTSALSMVVSSGSTLGHASAVQTGINIYLINNAGTIELAVSSIVKPYGTTINTTAEGGAGAADSRPTVYSTTARTGVPFVIIGYALSTQATAGTWVTNPSVFLADYREAIAATMLPTVQRFTSGSGTYTTPELCKYIVVEMVGGGGGGQGSRESTWAAGAGAGGNTSFGTRTANGGAGGNITGGFGGSVSGSGYTVLASCNGGDGSSGSVRASGGVTEISSGSGAASFFGGNGGGRISGVVGLAGAGNTGSGGSGAGLSTTFSGTSGAGGGAGAYYKFLINNPAATYSYAVGAGGTGGAAGTNGFVGGAGGSGVIIVTEYYS